MLVETCDLVLKRNVFMLWNYLMNSVGFNVGTIPTADTDDYNEVYVLYRTSHTQKYNMWTAMVERFRISFAAQLTKCHFINLVFYQNAFFLFRSQKIAFFIT